MFTCVLPILLLLHCPSAGRCRAAASERVDQVRCRPERGQWWRWNGGSRGEERGGRRATSNGLTLPLFFSSSSRTGQGRENSRSIVYTYIKTAANYHTLLPPSHSLPASMASSSTTRRSASNKQQQQQRRRIALLSATLAATAGSAAAQNKANTWSVVGESGVSAQQLFRGQGNKVCW